MFFRLRKRKITSGLSAPPGNIRLELGASEMQRILLSLYSVY